VLASHGGNGTKERVTLFDLFEVFLMATADSESEQALRSMASLLRFSISRFDTNRACRSPYKVLSASLTARALLLVLANLTFALGVSCWYPPMSRKQEAHQGAIGS